MPPCCAKATEATATEATKPPPPPPRRIAGTPTYGYAATREAAMAAFVKSWRRGKDREVRFRGEADNP